MGEELRVRVDQDLCTGDGLCVQYAPEVFEFDVDGLAYVKDGTGELRLEPGAVVDVPAAVAAAVVDSAVECPGECIHVTDAAGRAVAGPDFVGMPAVPSRLTA
ncbi:MAG TPA: ferredoxin [Mycobacteriales bacterium]|nr:ferredoxin [Mycobacteriales bacterium]